MYANDAISASSVHKGAIAAVVNENRFGGMVGVVRADTGVEVTSSPQSLDCCRQVQLDTGRLDLSLCLSSGQDSVILSRACLLAPKEVC